MRGFFGKSPDRMMMFCLSPLMLIIKDMGRGDVGMNKKSRLLHLFAGLIIIVSLLSGCVGGGGGSDFYSISGTVVDDEGTAIDGVQIVVTGGKSSSTGTANGGKFALTSLDGYDFEPKSIEVSKTNTNVRFVGTPESPELYALTVENGTGGGEYTEGAIVSISANAPTESGQVFDLWTTSGGGSFADEKSESTSFTTPKGAVIVTASYRDAMMEDYFEFDGATGTITKYQKTGKYENLDEELDPVIPSSIHGKSVTTVGENAFRDVQITSVVIPEGITTIEPWAFNNNLLEAVGIPESVTTIGEYAFCANKLTTISIPDGITHIANGVFWLNELASVTIPTSVTHIGDTAFEDNLLASVVFPTSVTHIGSSAFGSNSLTSLEIPASVHNIGRGAFDDNQGLVTLVIPDNVFIDGHAFYQNSLLITTITIGSGVTLGENLLGEGDSFKDAYDDIGGSERMYEKEGSIWVKRVR